MNCYPTRVAVVRFALGSAALLVPLLANAAPAQEALVIGNGSYTAFPPVPACLQSAHAVAAALRNLGFNVVEREDASSGATDAAINEYSKRMAAAPGAVGVVYVCGYAVSFNDRPFLLPITANVTRPADVLTQGVLAKGLLDTLVRNKASAALLALDTVAAPGNAGVAGLDGLLQGEFPATLGAIAVSQAKPPDGPTPLAAALVANLKGPEVQVGPLLAAVQQQPGVGKGASPAALLIPTAQAVLAGVSAPAPAAPPAPAPTLASPAAAPPPPASPAASTPAPAPPAAAPPQAQAPDLPAEEQMTEADRRRVQAALVRLGYYAGQVDGVFGPESRAAIRRYQHELGVAMTGRLSAEQANKLASGR